MSPDLCPHCGADLPPNARVCPECGSDEKTGWSETAAAQGLGLPDDDFDHDEFERREFGGATDRFKPSGITWFWWVVAGLVAAVFAWVLLQR